MWAKAPGITAVALLALLFTSCAQAPGAGGSSPGGQAGPGPPQAITAVIRGDPHVLYAKLNVGNNFLGTSQLERMVNAGLTITDTAGASHPQLAEAVPTVENGLWTVTPDGRMETTWKLRPNLTWHDGEPFTSEDLLFTARMEQESGLAWVRNTAYDSVDQVTAPDTSTLTITWKRPYVEADGMFSAMSQRALPLPKHLLDHAYTEDKAGFLQLPYWSQAFVGTGPFKLQQWVSDSYLVLEAFGGYALGSPKIDQIEVRFVADTNTVVANILAGGVDVTIDGRSIPFEDGRNLAAQWQGGTMALGLGAVLTIFAQFLNADPPVVSNPQFRRALMYALDRQEIVDTIQGGLGGVAHTYLGAGQVEYGEIEAALVKYDYDARKTAQLMEGLGYTKGADGFYRDANGQKLSFAFHTTITSVNQKTTLAAADNWQRAGLDAQVLTIPLQRQSDLEFMDTLPAFNLLRIGRNVTAFSSLHSNQRATPENNFSGSNRGRYGSPELDALIDRYYVTIPRPERMQVLGQVLHHVTDQLPVMPVLFDPDALMVSNRLKNVEPGTPWKAQQWEVVRS